MSEWDCEHGNSIDLCAVCFRERIKELETYRDKYPPEYVDDLQHTIDELRVQVSALQPPFENWMRAAGLGIARAEVEKGKERIKELEDALKETEAIVLSHEHHIDVDEKRIKELESELLMVRESVADYMHTYEHNGGSHIITGRAWDRMRKASKFGVWTREDIDEARAKAEKTSKKLHWGNSND